jgi:hypothetical protein
LKLALEALKIARDQIVDPEYAPIGWSVSRLDEVLANGRQALAAPTVQEAAALAEEVIGCFHAAEIVGLTAALCNTDDHHLKDLVERRLMHALYAAQEATPPAGEKQ